MVLFRSRYVNRSEKNGECRKEQECGIEDEMFGPPEFFQHTPTRAWNEAAEIQDRDNVSRENCH
jgi:hypothetical protein